MGLPSASPWGRQRWGWTRLLGRLTKASDWGGAICSLLRTHKNMQGMERDTITEMCWLF